MARLVALKVMPLTQVTNYFYEINSECYLKDYKWWCRGNQGGLKSLMEVSKSMQQFISNLEVRRIRSEGARSFFID